MENSFKVGDKVILVKQGKHPTESDDWSRVDGIVLNKEYTVIEVAVFGWIKLKKDGLAHHPGKFMLASSDQKQAKIPINLLQDLVTKERSEKEGWNWISLPKK